MTKKETLKILAILKASYPAFYKELTDEEIKNIAELWYEMFEDDDFIIVANAVKVFVASDDKGFPPVIGMIKRRIAEIMMPEVMSEFTAWQLIKDALFNSYYSEHEFNKLPPILQKVVGDHNVLRNWGLMDNDRLDAVVYPNFVKSYRLCVEREKELMSLPKTVKKIISGDTVKLHD